MNVKRIPHPIASVRRVVRTCASLLLSIVLLAALVASSAPAGATTAASAISWAEGHSGQDFDNGMCLLFVAQAYSAAGIDIGSAPSALQYWQQNPKGYVEHPGDTSPSVGALVFWGATPSGPITYPNPDGHVGIYVGNDTVVSTSSWPESGPDVHEFSFSGRNAVGYPYLGWLSPTGDDGGDGPAVKVPVVNANGGVYWRSSTDYNTPIQKSGYGVYTGDIVQLTCWQEGASNTPPYYNNPLWYTATVVAGQGKGSGWVNDHFLNTGSNVPNQPVAGVPNCGNPPPPPLGTPVVNADGGVYWRSQPDYNTPIQQQGYGVYTGDTVKLLCWVEGASNTPPYYNNPLWYEATVIAGLGKGQGWVNDHFLNTGSNVPNQPVAGVPGCPSAPNAPGAPDSVNATPGDSQAIVAWSPPGSDGGAAITTYTATSSPGGGTCTTSGTSCTVGGLTNGTSYTLTVTATNTAGQGPASSPSNTVMPGVAPAFTSEASATFTTGTAGSFAVTASGSPVPAVSETGYLPSGVTFTDNGDGTAALAGSPAVGTAGSYPITITANNGIDPATSESFTLTVLGFRVTTTALPDATASSPYSAQLQASGGTGPYKWKKVGGALPKGLALQANGVLSGTVKKKVRPGNFTFTVLVTDSTRHNRQVLTQVLMLTVR